MADNNPFLRPRENKTEMVTFRMTPEERKACESVIGPDHGELVKLIREGIGLAIAKRQTEKKKAK